MLGVDLSHLRAEAERAQRVANAAALAGAIFMPNYQSQAFYRAQEEARKNGFVDGQNSATVTPEATPPYNYRLRVTVSEPVSLFFGGLFKLGTLRRITRSATAEYLPPLAMGSPDYVLGYPAFPTNLVAGGSQENFYLNNNGPYEIKENGDPYTPYFESYKEGRSFHFSGTYTNACTPSDCGATADGSSGTQLTQNVLQHGATPFNGYRYIIDDPVSRPLVIKLFDPYNERLYDLYAQCWDRGYPSVNPNCDPHSLVHNWAPSDIRPTVNNVAGGTCILGKESSTTCRSEGIDGLGATNGSFGQYGTNLRFTLSGVGHNAYDPTMTDITNGSSCGTLNCVIQAPFDAGDDPTPCGTSACGASPYAYKFINYAIIHGPGTFVLTVKAVPNANNNNKIGTIHNSYGIAVCDDGSDPSALILGTPIHPDPMATTSPPYGWDKRACPSPNLPADCPDPRLAIPGQPGSTCVHLYADGKMPIYNLLSAGKSLIPLGYIPADYAGKRLHIDLFDPGDIDPGSGSGCPASAGGDSGNCIEVLTPAGDITHYDGAPAADGSPSSLPYLWNATVDVPATGYTANPGNGTTPWPPSKPLDVSDPATPSPYNGSWVHLRIDIPPDYATMVAHNGGYWKVLYRIGGNAHDVTTWTMSIAGSAVHLVYP